MPDDFTLDMFLRKLGIEGNDGERTYVAPVEDLMAAADPNRVTAAEILGQAGDVPAAAVAAESPSADPYDGPMFPQAGEQS